MTEKRIARTEQTSPVRAWNDSVNLDSFSVKITTVPRPLHSVTAWMIAVMDQMKRTATFLALRTNSSAIRLVGVSWERGNAMAITTVVTVRMKIQPFVIPVLATLTRNSPARMVDVSRNRGTVTLIMIVAMDPTNRPTFADKETAQLDGNVVLNGATTVVSRSGSSVTEKTIAETVRIS